MRYFKYEEFDSPDEPGSGHYMDATFLSMLDELREEVNMPVVINSGYRTISHNKNVGGKNGSSHLKGLAVDISCSSSRDRSIIVAAALQLGISRIGIGKNFIHIDVDYTKSQNVIWLY